VVVNRDDWKPHELNTAEAYATTCNGVLRHIVEQLRQTELLLSQDKRAAVEVASLLGIAARLARDHLGLTADDFSAAAGDAFRRSV
jgi:hypothetical protein